MKFDKFGAFPKTVSKKDARTDNNNLLKDLMKLLPLLNKKEETAQRVEQVQKESNQNSSQNANAKAYADYLARHDAHVKKSKEPNQS